MSAKSVVHPELASELEVSTEGPIYKKFIDARAPATTKVYRNSLVRYCRHLKITNIDDLLRITNKLIEERNNSR